MDSEGAMKAQSSPGGQKVTARKKRSLEALEKAAVKRQKAGDDRAPEQAPLLSRPPHKAHDKPAAPRDAAHLPALQVKGPAAMYLPLSKKLLTGAVGKAMQLPDSVSHNNRKATSILMDALMTNPDNKTITHAEREYGQLDAVRLHLARPTARRASKPVSKKYSGKLASAKTRNALHLNLQRSDCLYRVLLLLHSQWKKYADKLFIEGQSVEAMVWDHLELHCSWLEVIRSKNPRLVGVAGIVAKDSSSSFHIVDPEDRYHICPKGVCSFQLTVGGRTMILNTGRLGP